MKTTLFASSLLVGSFLLGTGGGALAQTSNPPGSTKLKNIIVTGGDNTIGDLAFLEKWHRQNDLRKAAEALLKQKMWKAAEAKFKEAIAVDPQYVSPYAYAGIAEAAYQQGRIVDAYNVLFPRFFGKSHGLENNSLLLIRFMELAERCKEPKLIERIWAQLIELSPKEDANVANTMKHQPNLSQHQARALALVAAGDRAENSGDSPLGKKLLNRALKYDPNCALAHFKLARHLGTHRESLTEAQMHWEKVIQYGDSNIRKVAELEIKGITYFIGYYRKK